jgi:hypothetical protein
MSWTDSLPTDRHHKLAAALDDIGADHLRYAADDRGFAMFLLVTDYRCCRHHCVSIFDLEDALWRDFYDEGLSPAEALDAARDSAGQ